MPDCMDFGYGVIKIFIVSRNYRISMPNPYNTGKNNLVDPKLTAPKYAKLLFFSLG